MDTKKLSYLALLIASTIAGKIFFNPLPNIQPVTTVIIFTGIYFGFFDALIVNVIIMFISNLYLGFGIWTFYQIIAYTVIIIITVLLKKNKIFLKSILLQAAFAFLSGFIYGFVISVFNATLFSNIKNYWTYLLMDIPFNILHGVGNFIIYLILVPILVKITNNYFNGNLK